MNEVSQSRGIQTAKSQDKPSKRGSQTKEWRAESGQAWLIPLPEFPNTVAERVSEWINSVARHPGNYFMTAAREQADSEDLLPMDYKARVDEILEERRQGIKDLKYPETNTDIAKKIVWGFGGEVESFNKLRKAVARIPETADDTSLKHRCNAMALKEDVLIPLDLTDFSAEEGTVGIKDVFKTLSGKERLGLIRAFIDIKENAILKTVFRLNEGVQDKEGKVISPAIPQAAGLLLESANISKEEYGEYLESKGK